MSKRKSSSSKTKMVQVSLGLSPDSHPALVPIVKKLETIDWSPIIGSNLAKEMVFDFGRFLAIKAFIGDLDATKVSPPDGMIDAFWHAAILNTRFYANLMVVLGVDMIHHNPKGASEEETVARAQRKSLYFALYKELFGSRDDEEDDEEVKEITKKNKKRKTSTKKKKKEESVPSPPGGGGREEMKLFVKGIDGKTITIIACPSDTVLQLKEKVESAAGHPVDQQRLIHAGIQLEDEKTLSEYPHIQSQSTIHEVLRLSGC
jgi:ubiquitin-large subunit ribosomal protein L40e